MKVGDFFGITPNNWVILIIVVVALFCASASAATPSNHTKTQMLLYLVGSDLESDGGAGTSDLMNIIESYDDTDPVNFDIIVAFGGAKKTGWEGMKVATMKQLREDAKDETFGNGRDYLYSDAQADMGSGQSFNTFLKVAKSSQTADRIILIISDHGGSYSGIGVDEISSHLLLMGDIDTALKTQKNKYDPIIFDACLMGSIEVAKTVQPYTRLMLGSEEIQWGSYDYDQLVGPLAKNPAIDSKTLNKMVADSYISRNPEKANIKTMSVIDPSKVPAITENLNVLGGKLLPISKTDEGLHDLKAAYNNAIKLGVSDGNVGTSVDLVSLLTNIGEKRPELSSNVQKTIGLAKKAVIYEKHNSYSQAVSGISIASPDAMTPEEYAKYGQGVKISPKWDEFFITMVAESQGGDNGQPSAGEETEPDNGSTRSGEAVFSVGDSDSHLSKPDFTCNENGTCTLDDPYNDASVYAAYFRVNGQDLQSLGTQPITKDRKGLYQIPSWDGKWYYYSTGYGSAGPLLVDLQYDSTTIGGHDTYYSWISMKNNQDRTNATLVTFVNRKTDSVETLINPCYETEDGGTVFGDSMDRFDTGDTITSYTDTYRSGKQDIENIPLAQTTAVSDMKMMHAMLPDGKYAAGIIAYYDNDDVALADDLRVLTIRNGVVSESGVAQIS